MLYCLVRFQFFSASSSLRTNTLSRRIYNVYNTREFTLYVRVCVYRILSRRRRRTSILRDVLATRSHGRETFSGAQWGGTSTFFLLPLPCAALRRRIIIVLSQTTTPPPPTHYYGSPVSAASLGRAKTFARRGFWSARLHNTHYTQIYYVYYTHNVNRSIFHGYFSPANEYGSYTHAIKKHRA